MADWKKCLIFICLTMAGSECSDAGTVSSALDAPGGDKLLQPSDFTYLGAFRVPKGDLGGPRYQGLAYGGSVIAYNPAHDSLFIVGHDHNQRVAEISIPAPVKTSDAASMNTARVIQKLSDLTKGNMAKLKADGSEIKDGAVKLGGLIRYGDKLLGSVYACYDGDFSAVRSHFRSGPVLAATGGFEGMFEVGSKPAPVPQAGFVAGFMTAIPGKWQDALGGSVLTGLGTVSILGRTSSGPAAFSFKPESLGSSPAPTTALLYYPLDHQTLGTYYSSGTLFNKGTHISGVVFPPGTRSIIFTGRQGMGAACYGPGTNNPSEQGNRYHAPPPNNTCMGTVMTDTADPCCYDPVDLSKGAHAYPYADYLWAYDAGDLLSVKRGSKMPWEITPYACWELKYPTTQKGNSLFSGASGYDPVKKRLYLVQVASDVPPYAMWPVIHVFELNIPSFNAAPLANPPAKGYVTGKGLSPTLSKGEQPAR